MLMMSIYSVQVLFKFETCLFVKLSNEIIMNINSSKYVKLN